MLITHKGSAKALIYYIPGIARAFAPGNLSYLFKWEGASHSIDAACAEGTTSVALACSALLSRECDTALAGGGSFLTVPSLWAGQAEEVSCLPLETVKRYATMQTGTPVGVKELAS